MKALVAAVITCALLFSGLSAQQAARPGRDVPPAPLSGTASIWGTVTIDGPDGRPARGAVVMLDHTEHVYGDTTVTDDEGRFEFKNIPSGRYLIGVEKDGYVTTRFGATKPGRAGTPVAIADGMRVDGMQLKLVRGSVLTGVVRDQNGEAAQGARVVVKRVVTNGGTRRFVDVYSSGDAEVDDRGVYRIYGLAAGEYILQAIPIVHDHDGGSSSARPTTAADVAWARAMLRSPAEIAARAGAPAAPPPSPSLGHAPIYYPNTLQQSAAAVIAIASGEERAGLDFSLSLLPTFRVTGVVNTPAGTAPSEMPTVYLAELSGTGGAWYSIKETNGVTFSFGGVPPGRYAVATIMEDSRMWAIANVTVGAQNETVALTLQPGLSASGQLVFQGTRPVPPDLTHVGLYWQAVAVAGGVTIGPPSSEANADGTFTVKGLVPGSYRMMASVMDGDARAADAWTLRSVMVGDRDIADVPLEVRPGTDVGKIVVTFTDKPTELSGRLQDASGRAASDYFIIVFSSDERAWSQNSRRIRQTRPASDGHFSVRGLPPGEYLLAALTDVERDEWYDAGFLRELIPTAARITLGEGEKKVQDIKIAGRPDPTLSVSNPSEASMATQGFSGLSAALAAVLLLTAHPAAAQTPVRVGGDIAAPVRTEYVAPVYPALAQQARVQGTVVLEIVIGPTGTVTDARVLRQNPLLDAASVEAVKKWKYTPTLLNGAPVPVIMTVTLNFDLGKDRRSPVVIEATINKDGTVRDTRVINIPPAEIVQPKGPLVSMSADPKVIVVPQGYVIVDVTIAKDGTVRQVTLIRGDATLAAPALDAVRQWRYPPTFQNGAPIEVVMTVLVPIK